MNSISLRALLVSSALVLFTACGGGGGNPPPPPPPASIDMTGTWQLTLRAKNVVGTDCDLQNNQVITVYTSVTQTADTADSANLQAVIYDGTSLTGTVNLNTGAFNLSGNNSRFYADTDVVGDPNIEWTADVTVQATVSGNSVSAGTDNVQVTEQFDGATSCTFAQDVVSGNKIYQVTGNEDYNGVYAIEMLQTSYSSEDPNGSESRAAVVAELEINGSSITAHLPTNENVVQQSVSNASFDPATGFFSFTIDETYNFGFETEDRSRTVSGLFHGDPQQTSGAIMHGYFTSFMIRSGEGPILAENVESQAHAKLLTTSTMTRTIRTKNTSFGSTESVLLGFANPSLKKVVYNEKLKFQVLDLNAAQGNRILCETPYFTGKDGDGRYFLQLNMPDPGNNEYRGNTYSTINCSIPIDQVNNTTTYTLRKLGSGTDGAFETTDDVVAATDNATDTTMTADVAPLAERYTATAFIRDINVGGFNGSSSVVGRVVPLHGFINPTQPLAVAWSAVEPGLTDIYQLRLLDGDDVRKRRYRTTNTNYTLPADTIGDGKLFRILAVNQLAGGNAQSYSRRLEVLPGIRGIFNVEMVDAGIPLAYQIFQVYLRADGNNAPVCNVQNQAMIEAKMVCSDVSVDYATNTATLIIFDVTGEMLGAPNDFFSLVLQFAANNTNIGQASVSSPAFANMNGVARAVNSSMRMRTILMGDGSESTLVSVRNPIDTNLLESLEFRALSGDIQFVDQSTPLTGVTLLTARQFYAQTINGNAAQGVGLYYSYLSASPFVDGQYRVHNTGLVGEPAYLQVGYGYRDPAAFITPTLAQVSVVEGINTTSCAATCTSGSPALVSGDFDIEWTIDTPANPQRWQLVFFDETAGATDPVQVRTLRRVAGTGPFSAVDNQNQTTTYRWTNAGSLLIPEGSTYRVEIRVTEDADEWFVGGRPLANQSVYITNVVPQ